jgi:transketolase
MTDTARALRRIIIEQSWRAHVGHIGSALCVADILAVLYDGLLRASRPDDPGRDRFVLSKGHAALALYAALHVKGWLPAAQLDTYCGDNTLLGVHPEHALAGVDFCTGALGQGLSYGVGAALAARFQGSPRRVYVLLSDAECNEGSLWESVMFAAHHKLSNIAAIVDLNGQQALGHTKDVLDMSPMADRWRAFGWDVRECDGHDAAALTTALDGLGTQPGAPRAVIARTVFGKGVSFMHHQVKWHYWPMSDGEYRQALDELGVTR